MKFARYEQALLANEYAEEGLPSPVQGNLKLHDLVNERGEDLINLSIMTDQTPPAVVRIAAAEQALKGGYIKNALFARKKIRDFYEREHDVRFDPESEVFLTTGSQLGLDSAFKLLIEAGDEVVLAEPEYATYEPMIHFYGGKAKFVPLNLTGDLWSLDLELFEKAVSSRTKLVVISNPNNPAGYVYRRNDIAEIAKIVEKNDCWLLSDEIWSPLIVKDGLDFTSPGCFDEIKDHLVILFSASKVFGMSGYRTGVIMGPRDFIRAIDQVVRFAVMAVPTIGQVAFARALDFDETGEWLKKRKQGLQKRIAETVPRMNSFEKLRCGEPESGVFLFPNIKEYGMSSLEFASRLITEKGLYVMPGLMYGRHCDGYLRISMSVPNEDFKCGMERFFDFIGELEA